MDKCFNLSVLGTSHIARQSIAQVKTAIQDLKPHIIALELDSKRFQALFHRGSISIKDIFKIGLKPFILNLIGAYAEKKLGKLVGTSPGDEMRQAVLLAKKYKIHIALIDQDIEITLKKLLKRITFREKFRFVKEFVFSVFKPKKIEFDLSKVPSQKIIQKLVSETRKNYPSVYITLILERNIVMAKALYKLMALYPEKKILAIVGAGHEKDIIAEIEKSKKEKNS